MVSWGVWYDWGNELLERMTIQQSKNVESIKMVVFLGKMLSLPDGKFHCSWLVQNHYMGASQIIRSGTRSGTTPVPYPRSIPPVPYPRSIPVWRIRSIPLFHTFGPYVMIYIYTYTISIYLNMCSLILDVYAHTWAHIHTWVRTCKNTFTMAKPCDCVGKSVPAAPTAATNFVVWW